MSPPFFAAATVKRLLAWKMLTFNEQEGKVYENAVKTLVRKTHLSKQLGELEKAISTQNPGTKCITITRPLFEQMYASCGNNFPHTLFCRLWRWPEVQSHDDLRSMETCANAYKKQKSKVCVNPYHFEKVEKCISEPVFTLLQSSSAPVDPPIQPEAPASYPSLEDHSYHAPGNSNLQASFVPGSSSTSVPGSSTSVPESSTYGPGSSTSGPESSTFLPGSSTFVPESSTYVPGSSTSGPESSTSVPGSTLVIPAPSNVNIKPVPYSEPAFWCSITYYELGQRVGESFHAYQHSVIVDGGTDPINAERFCLGQQTNIHRDSEVEQARMYIREGVRLCYEDGDVSLECLSKTPVFVQSLMCNQRYGVLPNTVIKIPKECNLKIFRKDVFGESLSKAATRGFEAVYQLMKMCIIRMSFVKPWGLEHKRQTLASVPCWIEIHLNGPLQWLDKVLKQLGSPTT
uniref:Mothers against decapentaplegic homolog n=1 Tax=Podarcis muralis TaxID=64176 RepID=A0A670K241_PODMU